jgi:hypothetical protein
MAIKKEILDELLKDKDPKTMFSSDGLCRIGAGGGFGRREGPSQAFRTRSAGAFFSSPRPKSLGDAAQGRKAAPAGGPIGTKSGDPISMKSGRSNHTKSCIGHADIFG